MHIHSIPIWIVSFVECPSVRIELVREYQSVFVTVLSCFRHCGLWGVAVY